MTPGIPDADTMLVALGVAGVGTICVLRILTGLIEQETRLHDTKVKVALLQIGYLERARNIRAAQGGEAIEVCEASDDPE